MNRPLDKAQYLPGICVSGDEDALVIVADVIQRLSAKPASKEFQALGVRKLGMHQQIGIHCGQMDTGHAGGVILGGDNNLERHSGSQGKAIDASRWWEVDGPTRLTMLSN
jgi:hypothetical protein